MIFISHFSRRGAPCGYPSKSGTSGIFPRIKDSGIGIAQADQKRLFTRFFRAENAVSSQEDGTGLGLAICLEIVERHGGEIQVDSELGKGSRFRILLPLQSQS